MSVEKKVWTSPTLTKHTRDNVDILGKNPGPSEAGTKMS